MPSYLITYELHERYGDYSPLINKLTSLGDHWFQYSDRVWIITSHLAEDDIRTLLAQFTYKKDKLLVLGLSGKAAWTERHDGFTDWAFKFL